MGARLDRAWTDLVGRLSPAQSALVLGGAAAGAVLVAVRTVDRGDGWPARLLMAGVAADLVGGLITFQLGPTRERYAETAVASRLGFVAAHLQPFALPLIGQGSWRRAGARYATVLLTSAAVEAAALSPTTRRRIATAVGVAAALMDVVTAPPGQRWFGPVYHLKLIGGHTSIPHAPGG